MSIHPSLRGVNTLVGERSVFTRVERLQKLMKEGKLSEEDSVYGLPKVRTSFKVKSKKKVDETDDAEAASDESAAE
jgi:small basic protein (TIGR04137 family)